MPTNSDSAAQRQELLALRNADAQAEWFIAEVKRCREIGMPLGCCDEWPECSHVLAWCEANPLPGTRRSRWQDGNGDWGVSAT